ncbi:MAG: hypothetical protein ABIV47_08950 [Roseiflexaceae bacterium]
MKIDVVVRLLLHSSSPPGALWALGFVLPAAGFSPAGSAVQRVFDYYKN